MRRSGSGPGSGFQNGRPAGSRGNAHPEVIRIGEHRIARGERARLEIPAARLATGSPVGLPVEVLHGANPGPRVWLSAAIHGDELNGVEIIRQVLGECSPRRLSGSLIAVPIVNVFGFITESRYLPDRRDLNRSFPGSARGSLAARIAHIFMKEVVEGCQVGIDLHTGSADRTNLPQIRADLDDPETRELARAFGAPIAIHSGLRDGSLRAAAGALGARVLVYEGGEPRRFNRGAIEAGVVGTLRVLAALGMRRTTLPPPDPVLESRGTSWVRAGRSGLFRAEVEPGSRVTKGQRIGVIKDAFGNQALRVKARANGVVIGLSLQPHVNRGDALVHIAEVAGD